MNILELREIINIHDWESCTVDQLGEENELDYGHWVGTEHLARAIGEDGTIYVHLTQQLVNFSIDHFDIWRRIDEAEVTGWVLRSYRVRVCEELFDEEEADV